MREREREEERKSKGIKKVKEQERTNLWSYEDTIVFNSQLL